jgi:hypothetical protein
VYSLIQLVSQVLPLSSEKACSDAVELTAAMLKPPDHGPRSMRQRKVDFRGAG